MARKHIAMTPDEQHDFLVSGRNLQVATLGIDGWPHLTTLWYVVIDGSITFRSFSKSQRIVNLTREPRLTVLVEAGTGYESLQGVMIKGTAHISTERHDVLDAYHRVTAKYQNRDVTREVVEQMFGAHADKNAVVTVEPRSVISWDHRKLAGGY
ncbi:MAG: pyridoxamine 5'-phosphate oxidase family protein [Acidimicrobiia bacterium]|nr:pyridoxamine 5'-phosphate oxidase family protein [Acidimicrobiia bacterium]